MSLSCLHLVNLDTSTQIWPSGLFYIIPLHIIGFHDKEEKCGYLSVECRGKKKPTSSFFVAIYYYEYKTSKRSSMKFKEKEVGQMVTSYNELLPTIL